MNKSLSIDRRKNSHGRYGRCNNDNFEFGLNKDQ